MKRYHFFPNTVPKGILYDIQVLQGGSPNYKQTLTSWNSILEFLQKKWYRRFPFRLYEPWISWEVWADNLRTKYFLWAPNEHDGYEVLYRLFIENGDLSIVYAENPPKIDFSRPHAGMRLFLERDFTVPLEIHSDPQIDSQTPFLEFLANVPKNHEVHTQFLVRPVYEKDIIKSFRKALYKVEKDKYAPPGENEFYRKAILEKQQHMKAEIAINLLAYGETKEGAAKLVDECARTLSYMNSGELNRFEYREWWQMFPPMFRFQFKRRIFPFRRDENKVILGTHELSGLLRPPSSAGTSKFIRVKGRRVLIPVEIRPHKDIPDSIFIGNNFAQIGKAPIHLPFKYLDRHISVFGGSNMGKSTFVLNALLQYMHKRTTENRLGFMVVDTKGSLADGLLQRIPEEMQHLVRVIRFRVGNVPFNPYDMDFHASLSRKANLVAEIFKKINPDYWNPIVEEHFLYGGIALLKLGLASLSNLQRLIEDETFCKRVMSLLDDQDPENISIQHFLKRYLGTSKKAVNWRREFLLSPAMTRLRGINTSGISSMLNRYTNGVRWRESLDNGYIHIFDLGGLTPGDKRMIGTAIITLFQQAMTTRENALSNGEELPLHPLVVDDATLYVNQSFGDLEYYANEARKYKTPLILTISGIKHQISNHIAETIFRNFGTNVVFQLGNPADAKFACENLNSIGLITRDYHMIEPYFSYIQTLQNNERTRAFTLKVDPPGEIIFDGDLKELAKESIEPLIERENQVKEQKEKELQELFAKADQVIERFPEMKGVETDEQADEDEIDDYIDMLYGNNEQGKGYYYHE